MCTATIEVALSENSLQPTSVLAIRFGDQNRDYVDDQVPETPVPWTNGQVTSRNLRLTGFLPMTQEWANNFPGRYLVEAKGFVRRVTRQPEYNSAGEPRRVLQLRIQPDHGRRSPHGCVHREQLDRLRSGNGQSIDSLHLADEAVGVDVFPRKVDQEGTGLTLRRNYDNDARKTSIWVDGKVEGDFNQFWPIGCTGADTYTFRTRAPLTTSPLAYTGELFQSGEFVEGRRSRS